MKKIILILGIILMTPHHVIGQEQNELQCLQGLWEETSLEEDKNEITFEIYSENDFISMFSYKYKDTLRFELHLSKKGYVNQPKKDSINVNEIKMSGKYFIHAGHPENNKKTVDISVYYGKEIRIDCDEESYDYLGPTIISYSRRQYLPLKIWNQLKIYCKKTKTDYIKEFELEKYNPAISIAQGTVLYKDAELKTKIKTLSKIYQVQVIEQMWNMLKIKCRDFEGWIDIKNVIAEKL